MTLIKPQFPPISQILQRASSSLATTFPGVSQAFKTTQQLVTATTPLAFLTGCNGTGAGIAIATTAGLAMAGYAIFRQRQKQEQILLNKTTSDSLLQGAQGLVDERPQLINPLDSPVITATSATSTMSIETLRDDATSTMSIIKDPWLDCAKQLKSPLILPLLRYYQNRFGAAELDELIGSLGTKRVVLEDPDRWFSAALFLKLIEAMKNKSGDPNLAYKAGLALADPGIIGPVERFAVKHAGSSRMFLSGLATFTRSLSNVTTWEANFTSRTSATVTFTPTEADLIAPGISDDINFCDNRRGVLEKHPALYGLDDAIVEHPQCLHKGHDACVYNVRWVNRPQFSRLENISSAVLISSGLALSVIGISPTLIMATVLPLLGTLRILGYRDTEKQKLEVQRFNEEHIAQVAALSERNTERLTANDGLSMAYIQTNAAAQKLAHFLPPDAVNEIMANPIAALELGGQEAQVSVMFCDIASFTSMSQASTPHEVVDALNAWFSIVDPIIKKYGGIVDKRIGDAVLAVFRDSNFDSEHAVVRSIQASLEMQRALKENKILISAKAPLFADIKVRIALHFGDVIAGNLGSPDRMEYTVIGDAVNVAARLEALTPESEIWFTGAALMAAGNAHLTNIAVKRGTETFRGRSEPSLLFSVPVDTDPQDF